MTEQTEALTKLIATEVMGWHKVNDIWWVPVEYDSFIGVDLSNVRVIDNWHPLTNIRDTMDVIERLADLGHVILIKADDLRDKAHRYNVIGAQGRLSGDRATPMEAICEAALMLVDKD